MDCQRRKDSQMYLLHLHSTADLRAYTTYPLHGPLSCTDHLLKQFEAAFSSNQVAKADTFSSSIQSGLGGNELRAANFCSSARPPAPLFLLRPVELIVGASLHCAGGRYKCHDDDSNNSCLLPFCRSPRFLSTFVVTDSLSNSKSSCSINSDVFFRY